MKLRTAIFWVHLVAGCAGGLIILLMSFTGVILTYERQILSWTGRAQLLADPPSSARRLSPSEIVDAARRSLGALPESSTLTLRSDPREPAEVRAGRQGVLYVNPYSGIVTANQSSSLRGFFQKTVAWHRWLGTEGPGRSTARAVTGACNLAFLVLIITGAILWLPRQWSHGSVLAVAWFRPRLTGKARDFNWHNVFGVWALVPLFFVVLTALPMSYSWANDLLYTLTGSTPPAPAPTRPPGRPNAEDGAGSALAQPVDVARLWDRASRHIPAWKSITAPAVLTPGRPVSFSIDTGNGGQPQKRSTLTLHHASAEIIRYETFDDAAAGRRLRMWSRFVHTGEYYGLAGQTLAGAASFAAVVLVLTGMALAVRRFAAWNTRRRRATGRLAETVGVGAQHNGVPLGDNHSELQI